MGKPHSPHGWAWPLPGNVPWSFDRLKECEAPFAEIPAKLGTLVHAVESGTIADKEPLVVQGESGLVHYWGVWKMSGIEKEVQQGEPIGKLSTSPPVFALRLSVESDTSTDVLSLIRPAWCRVTDRFHRDAPPPPRKPEDIRNLIRWLQEHPLWHYPISIPVPPEGVPDDLIEREDGLFELPDASGWPRKMERWGGGMHECLSYDFVYVEPTTEMCRGRLGREEQDPRNTAFRVWIEGGGWMDQSQDPDIPEPPNGWTEYNKWISCHDPRLNCGAHSMEEALIQLALKVQFYYTDEGNDREVPKECDGGFKNWGEDDERYVSGCVDAGDGFCKTCGYLIDAPEIDDEEDDGQPTQS